MSLVSQQNPNILGGVSQAPQQQRDPSQGEIMVNVMDSIQHGKTKRPPSMHVAKLATDPTPYAAGVFVHEINRSEAEKYTVVVADGDLKVYDKNGVAVTVTFPNGKGYLGTSPTPAFRAITVEDYTFITNTSVPVAHTTALSPAQKKEALISVALADYGTTYTITLDGTVLTYTTGDAAAPDSRPQLSTDFLANLFTNLINTTAPLSTTFTATQYGSAVYVVKQDGTDFTLTCNDGLADSGLLAVKGSVQNFNDLPSRAVNGFLVQITGDPSNAFDNYWVQYNDEGLPQQDGVWIETIAPGILTTLDPATMPYQLVRSGAIVPSTIDMAADTALPVVGTGNIVGALYGIDGHSADSGQILNYHGASCTITPTLDGHAHTYVVNYDVNTANLVPGVKVSVVITAGLFQVSFKTYGAGLSLPNESQTFTKDIFGVDFPNGTIFKIATNYSPALTPASSHVAQILIHALNQDPRSSMAVNTTLANTYTFPLTIAQTKGGGKHFGNALYPTGSVVTVQGVATTLASDTSPTALATLLATKTYAGFTASNPLPGVLWLTTTGTPPPVAGSCTISFNATEVFFNSTLALVPNVLIGATIVNETKGGTSAVITANTATTITVGSSLFTPGDSCHVLLNTGIYFTLQQGTWTTRQVGDDNTNPFPSFLNQTINELFFSQDRLGLIARSHVVLSGSDDLFNFFRTTVTDLLDGDMIDVEAASQQVSDFSSAVHWQEGTYLFADEVQTALLGDPILSPKTVSLSPQTYYPCAPIRALAMDRRIFFTRTRTNATQVFRLQRATFPQIGLDAQEITKQTPTYLPGNPLQIVGDPTLEMLFVLTDGAPNTVFVYSYHYESANLVQESISSWVFDAGCTILNIGLLDGVLYMVVLRADGLYLESVDTQIGLYDDI